MDGLLLNGLDLQWFQFLIEDLTLHAARLAQVTVTSFGRTYQIHDDGLVN